MSAKMETGWGWAHLAMRTRQPTSRMQGDGATPGGVSTRTWAPGDESGETFLGKELAGGDSEDG